MRTTLYRMLAAAALACGVWLAVGAQSPNGGVFVLSFQDAIGPATSDYIVKGLEQAASADASLVILEMDTPGGLDTSMREIIQAILNSPVPIASYVFPEGARAASAGTYILYASHIAAMAPATNLGAATPVAIGGGGPAPLPDSTDPAATNQEDGNDAPDDNGEEQPSQDAPVQSFPQPQTASERKAINDAVAYIQSLAELRGRNADWAERAVRGGESLSAEAALRLNVVDLIAENRSDLLRQIDGRVIAGSPLALPESTLITVVEPDWRTQLLAVISNPTVAYMLMLVGIYGLIFEGYNPGAIVPGVVGAISLLLAAFAFQILPINYAGLALMVLGVILMASEFFVPSFGALGIGGIAAFVFGSLILVDSDVPGFQVAGSVIGSIAFTGSLALMGTIWLAMKSRRTRVVSGMEEMIGLRAEALEDFEGDGHVWVHGERWHALSATPVSKGQVLTVTRIDGLVLQVEPATKPL